MFQLKFQGIYPWYPEIWCSALYSTLLAGSSSRDCRPCLVKKSPVFMQKCVDVVLKTPVFMLKSPVLILKFLVSLIKFLVGRSNPRFSWLHSCPQSTTCRHVPHLCAPAGPNSTLGFHKDATCHQHHDVTPVCDEKFTKFTPCLVNLYICIYIMHKSCNTRPPENLIFGWIKIHGGMSL